ncbi:MAG: tetratricopeptide repeat protein, partial [archaeon]|nr:tetratricopeptide repeat protein [archaeon]
SLATVLNKILSKDATHDSTTLCRMIEIISAIEAQGWTEDVRDLVEKRRSCDCHPVLTAAVCFARKGLLTDAEAYLDSLGDAPDKAFYHYVRAEIELAREEINKARNEATLSLCSNRLYHDAYRIMAIVDPDNNWPAYEAIERMSRGLPFEEPTGTQSGIELYRIYHEWYFGSHDTATHMLIQSEGYINKYGPFCILSARMSRDEKDWHSCQMMLEDANNTDSDDVSLQCELGRAYLNGDNPDIALARFRDAEAYDIANPEAVRGMIDSCVALGKHTEMVQSIMEFLSSELVTYDDYVHYARLLLDMGFNEQATEAAKKILFNHPGDVTACTVLSRVALNEGDYRGAESYAKSAVSKNKKNPEALAQLARVYLALRRTSKAAGIAKRAVSADKTSLVALITLMEIYRETGDDDRTVGVCRSILELDPGNNEAADILANLELAKAVKTSDDNLLPPVAGSKDFVRLISTLVSEGKYTEVVKLCKDNDHNFGSDAEVRRLRGNAEYALGEYLKASASFASAAVLLKGDPDIWHSKGLADEKFGDLDSAEEAYGKAILLDMNNPKYWISNGVIQEKKGDFDAAVKSFNRAIELDPRSTYALVRKAAIFAGNGLFKEALNFLELAEASDPRNVLIQSVKMKVCLKASRFTEAVFIGRKLVKKDPDSSTVAVYARANMGIQDYSTAKKVLDKALDSEPNNLELLTAYRDLCVLQADNDNIIDTCNFILKLDPNDKATKRALADALIKEGRSDEANLLYASLKTENESGAAKDEQEIEDPQAMFNIAKSMFAAGDLISAARLTDRAMSVDPDNLDYVLFRTQIYRKSGDKRVADMFLSEYLERNPNNGAVHEAIGDMRVEDGDYRGAADSYGKAIQNGIKRPGLYVKLGNVQEKLNATTPATNSYNTAVMLDPRDADANRYLANMLLKARDYEAALRSINASVASEPSGDAYAIMAMIYQGLKDRQGVRDAYQGFLRYENASEDSVSNVITALNSVGLRTEANMLKNRYNVIAEEAESSVMDVAPEIKRRAERIMRRAYMMGAEVTDPGISDADPDDDDAVRSALMYLADIPTYGEVIYGTTACAPLEELSFTIVRRRNTKDPALLRVEPASVP